MSGGLMQLVAYGAQDIYLTGNPQITFFKVVYRRHTNFAVESIDQTFQGNADFGKKVTALISRNGDLMHRVYLQTELPAVPEGVCGRWTDNVGHHLIRQVEVDIGGQRIDRQFGDWLQIWSALTLPIGLRRGYDKMIGHTPTLCGPNLEGQPRPRTTLYVPLQFWFNRNAGLALPLIALQYHEVRIDVEFRELNELFINTGNPNNVGFCEYQAHLGPTALYVDYVYLDTDERRRFAQVSHEYLIEQLQFTGEESICNQSSKVRLNFNHPTKELIWVIQKDAYVERPNIDLRYIGNQWSNYQLYPGEYDQFEEMNFSETPGNPTVLAKIQLNGHDRFVAREGSYFNLVQVYQHHTTSPDSEGINVYSFALRPEEHQPSGTVNFSRIDNACLQLNVHPLTFVVDPQDPVLGTTSAKLRVYALSYNVLRIMSGMGGLAYSN